MLNLLTKIKRDETPFCDFYKVEEKMELVCMNNRTSTLAISLNVIFSKEVSLVVKPKTQVQKPGFDFGKLLEGML